MLNFYINNYFYIIFRMRCEDDEDVFSTPSKWKQSGSMEDYEDQRNREKKKKNTEVVMLSL